MRCSFVTTCVTVFILLFAINTPLFSQDTCTVTADWSTGWGALCGGPNGNFACMPPWTGSGNWNGGCKTFSDCVPSGNIITKVIVEVYWIDGFCDQICDQFNPAINGVEIGQIGPLLGTLCNDGQCIIHTTYGFWLCSQGGIPGYVYGGVNTFCLNYTAGTICVDKAYIRLIYEPESGLSQPGLISGSTAPCAGTSQTYSIGTVSGAVSYWWSTPPGWTITGGQGTTFISVTTGNNPGNICVSAVDTCGTVPECITVSPNNAPAQADIIYGPINPPPFNTVTYSTDTIPGATSYQWTVPSGWTVSGMPSTTLNVTTNSNCGYVCVSGINSCGSGPFYCLNICDSCPTVSLSATDESCNGTCTGGCDGSVSVAISGGVGPFTYTWSNGCASSTCNYLCNGTYTVTVTDSAGCAVTDSIVVGVASAFSLSTGSLPDTSGAGVGMAWVSVSGGTPPYTYQWDDSLLQTTDTANNLLVGAYSVLVTDSNGCAFSDSVTVGNFTGITESNFANNLQIYPNPNTGQFILKMNFLKSTKVFINVFQITGQLIYSEQIAKITGNYTNQIDLSNYSKGVYFLQVSTDTSIMTRKVVLY